MKKNIILASSSPYRKKLLEDIGLNIQGLSPTADESTISEQQFSPLEVAQKRAHLKTQSISSQYPDSVVIGGDQLVNFRGEVLGKPYTVEKAVQQLLKMSGDSHELITCCEIHYQGKIHSHTDVTTMQMRTLKPSEAENYVRKDQPLDCAGAYKIEKSGLWLFERIQTNDHTSIVGLPLLFVTQTLSKLVGFLP